MNKLRYIRILSLSLSILLSLNLAAHPSWKLHANDMYDVFGFQRDADLTAWMKYISSQLIDGFNNDKIYTVGSEKVGFYDFIKAKYPPFKCKHRLLFHWGYNSRPWTDELQAKVESYKWTPAKIKAFQQELVNEQQRRNRQANQYTEQLFGFSSGGREAATARALLSIAYDVHLLGDLTPDNKDTDGLCAFSSIVGDIINNIRILDNVNSKTLIAQLQKASRLKVPEPNKAQSVLLILKRELRKLLRSHPDSRISSKVVKGDYE